MALAVEARVASLTGLRKGLLAIRNGQSGQPIATHLRASVAEPPLQSMHLARDGADQPFRVSKVAQLMRLDKAGNLPTFSPRRTSQTMALIQASIYIVG